MSQFDETLRSLLLGQQPKLSTSLLAETETAVHSEQAPVQALRYLYCSTCQIRNIIHVGIAATGNLYLVYGWPVQEALVFDMALMYLVPGGIAGLKDMNVTELMQTLAHAKPGDDVIQLSSCFKFKSCQRWLRFAETILAIPQHVLAEIPRTHPPPVLDIRFDEKGGVKLTIPTHGSI